MTQLPEGTSSAGLLSGLRAVARLLLRIPRVRALVPIALWAGGIWYLSSLPSLDSGDPRFALAFGGNLVHAFEFGVLALLLVLLLPRTDDWVHLTPRRVGAVAAVAILYGLVDEVHQSYVVGRDPSLLDWATDAIGVFCVLKIIVYISTPDSDSIGAWARMAYSVMLCFAAAMFATVYSFLFGEGPWI